MIEPFFISKIHITKVRHLENLDIILDEAAPKHLILTGKNGSGKTSLISAMEFIVPNNPRAETVAGIQMEYSGVRTPGHFFASFPAKRGIETRAPQSISKIIPNSRTGSALGKKYSQSFIQHLVNLKVERSFARDENDAATAERIDRWFDRFEKNLGYVFEDPNLRLEFDRKKYDFMIFQAGHEPFGFHSLSSGYAAILDVVAEILMRMDLEHKAASSEAYDQPGIVFIDELEAHLHVALQKKIFPFLSGFFPNIQFIVTTHSPFVLNSAENAVIYDLEKKVRVEDLTRFSYEGIIEGFFNVDQYSQAVKDQITEYEQLIALESPTEEQQSRRAELRRDLKRVSPELAPELVTHFQKIELDRMSRSA